MRRNYLIHCLIGERHHSTTAIGPLEVTKDTLIRWSKGIEDSIREMGHYDYVTILSFSPMNTINE